MASKNSYFDDKRQTEIYSNVATKTGNTYIPESMIDNGKIPTVNLGF